MSNNPVITATSEPGLTNLPISSAASLPVSPGSTHTTVDLDDPLASLNMQRTRMLLTSASSIRAFTRGSVGHTTKA